MVYLFLGNGFEEVEALTQVDYLRRAGIELKIVGVSGKKIIGGHGVAVEADLIIEDLSESEPCDMVILPGGLGGVKEMAQSEQVKKLVLKTFTQGKPVAAICAAPALLAKWGILEGKQATGYPGTEEALSKGGALVTNRDLVIDDNLITARAAGVSDLFAFALIENLCGKETSETIKKAICSPLT